MVAVKFRNQGYAFIPRLLDAVDTRCFRNAIQNLSRLGDADYEAKTFACPDGVSLNREFWPLIWNAKLLDTIRSIIGPLPRYTRHSDIHAHRTGGWHRDSACREFQSGPDWDESRDPYQVIRVAIYLQSFAESGSMLGVLPGSHRFEERLSPREVAYWRKRSQLWHACGGGTIDAGLPEPPIIRTRRGGIPYLSPPTEPIWIKTEPGDCIIFDQRLYHSACPIHGPKYAIFLSYSPENEHCRNHLRYYLHFRKDLKYGPLDSELESELKSRSLFVEVPEPQAEAAFTRV